MIPPLHGNTSILDRPELWLGKTIEEIANFRLSLVRGVTTLRVNDTSGRFIGNLQDLAMSQKSVESEATFEKQPLPEADLETEMRLNADAAPFGPSAPLKDFKLVSSTADKRIESAYYDTDLRASDAIIDLYNEGVENSQIHKVLSIGMLGGKKARKLVPTRWSITATDDVISKHLVDEIEVNPSIDTYEVRIYSHLANHYAVILLPDEVWSFEMIESWFNSDGSMGMGSDYENARGLDHYPSIAGAYFAAKLAVAEHLLKRKRKGAGLVLREIHPEYVMPLGVWQIREGVRQALKNPANQFEALAHALAFACSHLSVSRSEIETRSIMWNTFSSQRRITDFT
jgi:hypothetical protein